MRVLLFVVAVVSIFGAVALGVASSSGYWLAAIVTPQGSLDRDALVKVVVVLPAAIAALITALVSGVANLMAQGAQRAANIELDEKRNTFTKEMEDKKKVYTKELEEHKGKLAKELRDYEHQLEQKNAIIDEIKEAREILSLYRDAVGTIRSGTFDAEQMLALRQRLNVSRDRLPRNEELYRAWCEFAQIGLVLEERAEGKKMLGQRRAWNAPEPKLGDKALGVVFGNTSERVLALLNERLAHVRSNTSTPFS